MKAMPDFTDEVLAKIGARGAVPAPWWRFLLLRSVFWSLAALSVLSGSVALSIFIYVFFDNEGANPAVLLESPLEAVAQGAPLLWLAASSFFAASAYLSVRHTRKGYRYRASGIIAVLAATTLILGLTLSALDFGSFMHYYLRGHISFYEAIMQTLADPR